MLRTEGNKSGASGLVEALTPTISAPVFNAEPLRNFSLADFAELLEATGEMPTGDERVLSAAQLEQMPEPVDPARFPAMLDGLRRSRFRFLLKHLQPDNSDIGLLDRHIIAGILSFLTNLRSLFFHLAKLEREQGKGKHAKVSSARPGQQIFSAFTFTLATGFVVGVDGRLAGPPLEWFRSRNPVPQLVERLSKVLERADPARVRRCSFSKCGRIFYAKRADSLCCSRRCNNNRLQREWYWSEPGGKKDVVYQRPKSKGA